MLPDGFEAIFGPRPHSSQFRGGNAARDFQVATVTWENNLRTYVGPGMPDDADSAKVETANNEAVKYEMGEPAYYENNNGVKVRFPDSQDPDSEAPFDGFVNIGTGQIIVSYQNRLTNQGIIIPANKMHPMAPPVLLKRQDELREAAAKAAEAGQKLTHVKRPPRKISNTRTEARTEVRALHRGCVSIPSPQSSSRSRISCPGGSQPA